MTLPFDDGKRDLTILEQLDQNPDATQAILATHLGVAVGTINWHLKRLVAKGYVKVRRSTRRKLRYIITPEGLALRARLTLDYINTSFQLYRLVRQRMNEALSEVERQGYRRVRLVGDGDVAEICRLTCLEKGVEVVQAVDVPLLSIQGLKVRVDLPENGYSPDGMQS
ncbi:MAG TPA: winged helix-turn-helix transcriptional regulator [Anaerolineales bacterium]